MKKWKSLQFSFVSIFYLLSFQVPLKWSGPHFPTLFKEFSSLVMWLLLILKGYSRFTLSLVTPESWKNPKLHSSPAIHWNISHQQWQRMPPYPDVTCISPAYSNTASLFPFLDTFQWCCTILLTLLAAYTYVSSCLSSTPILASWNSSICGSLSKVLNAIHLPTILDWTGQPRALLWLSDVYIQLVFLGCPSGTDPQIQSLNEFLPHLSKQNHTVKSSTNLLTRKL